MDRAVSHEIGRLLEDGASLRMFSAAQAAVADGRGLRASAAAGRTAPGGGARTTRGTLFDIASLTKIFTASATLRLAARGVVGLGARLDALLPELRGAPAGAATLEQALAHEAGFTAWLPLFERVEPARRGTPEGRETVLELALAAPPEARPGERAIYSDLGFVALGEALERASGRDLATLIAAEVTGPLGLAAVRPGPVRPGSGCAATGDCPWRGRVLRGEVHDDNARAMGGLAGHAGLFSTAADVARLGAAWLEARRGRGWLPAELALRATARRPLGRGLGWDFKSAEGSSAGARLSDTSFGHLGFTGCSLWTDPEAGVAVALLTNRVCYGRDNDAIRAFRPAFHDAVMDLLARAT